MFTKRMRIWECALLLALSLSLVSGVWAAGSQSALAGRILRLHVIANSDSPADQALKLRVRDAVLAAAGDCLDGVSDRAQAEALLSARLPALTEAAREAVRSAGYAFPVTLSLTDCWFPTKEYETFSLPAGTYRALRVVIGEGAGQNWWCVVFPPLCLGTVTDPADTAAMAGLSQEQISLITAEDNGYVLKFRLVEWWQKLFKAKGRR